MPSLADYLNPRSPEWDAWRSNMDAPRPEVGLAPHTPSLFDELLPAGVVARMRSSDMGRSLIDYIGAPRTKDTFWSDGGNTLAMLAGFVGPGAKVPAKRLPMDYESRMARATEMGFRPVYHGTAFEGGQPFREFRPDLVGGRVTGSQAAREGISVAPDPALAGEFARLAHQRTGGDPAVMPLMYRSNRRAALTLDGTETNLEVAATLNAAFREGGYDAVVLRNYKSPEGVTGQTAIVVKNPNQLRSTSAAFDPAKKDSADLLASKMLPFAVGGGLALYGSQESP